MKTWSDWQVVRHQVAICGRVTDRNKRPVAGAQVSLVEVPDAFKFRVDGASISRSGHSSDERRDRTLSRSDGIFYFLDLPTGSYTVKVSAPQSGADQEEKVSVSWDKDGNISHVAVDFSLS